MRKTLFLAIVLSLLLVASLLPATVFAKDDKATEVEISPKIQLRGPASKGKPSRPTTASTGFVGAAAPESAHRWAIVIGISDYAGTVNDLAYADDDALEMYTVLTETYGFPEDNIALLIDGDASSGAIIDAIASLEASVDASDEVVFFYSGHGARGRANDGDKEATDEAIVPYECTVKSLIWDGDLRSMFSAYKTNRIVFIFDSCYAGGMNDLGGEGRLVLMACSENSLSYEGSWGGGNGQFTYYLVEEGMAEGLADIHEKNGLVTVEEAFDYAKANCVQQVPVIIDSFTDDMPLG